MAETAPKTITEKNYLYKKYIDSVVKNRDCVEGQDAVKTSTKADMYLPMLSGHRTNAGGSQAYETYKNYAKFLPAPGRTLDGYVGIVTRKNPAVNINNSLEEFSKDVNGDGLNIQAFAKKCFSEVCTKYRVGVMLDAPTVEIPEGFISRRQAQTINGKPYLTIYTYENILDWREDYVNGKKQTVFVKLFEEFYAPSETDKFSYDKHKRIRVLELEDGVYTQTVYEAKIDKNEREEKYYLADFVRPVVNGSVLDYIPFWPITPEGVTWELDYAPMTDICDLAIDYYRDSAGYANGKLFLGAPTPCLKGLASESVEGGKVTFGPGTVLQFEENGDWGYLELGSGGLLELRESMNNTKEEMASVGARMLVADPRGVESAETAMIHRSGEYSVIGTIANSVSSALTDILNTVAKWLGAPEDNSFEFVVDFNPQGISPEMLNALMAAYQGGVISQETFIHNLKKGEMYKTDWTEDDEKQAIENSAFGGSDTVTDIYTRLSELSKRVDSQSGVNTEQNDSQ